MAKIGKYRHAKYQGEHVKDRGSFTHILAPDNTRVGEIVMADCGSFVKRAEIDDYNPSCPNCLRVRKMMKRYEE